MTIDSSQFAVREVADLDLVHAAKNGSVAAFEQLVSRYDRKLLRIAQSITHNREDSQDAVQEAFLKAYQNLSAFREDSKFSTWLFRITVNQSLMKLRKQRSAKEMSLEEDFEAEGDFLPKEVADWAPNPEQLYWASELRDILIECLAIARRAEPNLADGLCVAGYRRTHYRTDSRGARGESDGGEGATVACSAAASRGPEQVLQQADTPGASAVIPSRQTDRPDSRPLCRVLAQRDGEDSLDQCCRA